MVSCFGVSHPVIVYLSKRGRNCTFAATVAAAAAFEVHYSCCYLHPVMPKKDRKEKEEEEEEEARAEGRKEEEAAG